jgi:peptidyl-dipeptidase Dcp
MTTRTAIKKLMCGAAGAALLAGCTTMRDDAGSEPAVAAPPQGTGVFAAPSTLPFGAPDFTRIADADYRSGIEQGIAIQRAEIEAIANNPAAPTFDNTLVAMERSGQMLDRANAVFSQVQGANTNDTLDAIEAEMAPKLTALSDEINLNAKLFARVKAIYDNRAAMSMTPEDAMLLEEYYAGFVHAGALLDAAQKEQLKAINARISTLETEFSQKLTEATAAKAPIFDSAAELAGLSPAEIDAAAKLATEKGHPGKFAIALINTTQQPTMTRLDNRESRRKLFVASVTRTSQGDAFDTTAIAEELAELRARKAALLGNANWAEYAMYDRMVKQPTQAIAFMQEFVPGVAATQLREAAALLAYAKAHGAKIDKIEPWDWEYYAEKLRAERYSYDENALKPYFPVWKVLEDGVFLMATRLYGITFKRREDLPTYHPDMRVYTVFDNDGSELALFYFDPFARPNKQGGAWMSNFVEQSHLLGEKPVVTNTLNITKPADGEPALATYDDVNTMFHEFGHALHGIFANQRYVSLSGTNTARDFVEFPSQFHENFLLVPEVLNNFARHYQTGQVIPRSLVDKVEEAEKFNQGLKFGELLAAALLDMEWHDLTPVDGRKDSEAFEKAALANLALHTELVPPRYRTPYFRHIWSNGYSAGYYSYIWTEMLAHDAYDWVEHNGGMTRANGDHIRATFLGQGHTKDYAAMYRDFAGRDPQIAPMMEARGLAEPAK